MSPRSPTSTALLEHDLQYINEQTQTLLADKHAAEQRYADDYDDYHYHYLWSPYVIAQTIYIFILFLLFFFLA